MLENFFPSRASAKAAAFVTISLHSTPSLLQALRISARRSGELGLCCRSWFHLLIASGFRPWRYRSAACLAFAFTLNFWGAPSDEINEEVTSADRSMLPKMAYASPR